MLILLKARGAVRGTACTALQEGLSFGQSSAVWLSSGERQRWGTLVGQEGSCCCCGPRVPGRAYECCRQNSGKLYVMAINLFSNQILTGKHFLQLMDKGKRGGFRTGQKLCVASV